MTLHARFVALLASLAVSALCTAAEPNEEKVGPVPVKVVRDDDGSWALYRGGEPYHVKGAGAQRIDLSTVADRGGNSVRTWWIDMAADHLDAAHRHGLTVSLCLPVAAERFGVDYRDQGTVRDLVTEVAAVVARYKDHPALLSWIIGNELNYAMSDDSIMYRVVNELSKLIHQMDPHHPTTTTLAGGDKKLIDIVRRDAPDLDFLSIQTYGGIAAIPRWIRQSFKDQPLMITEWGPLGFWEVGKTKWDAPLEQTSSEKAERLLNTYERFIAPNQRNILGSYVFLWGQKQERTPTWFSMFTESGESTAAVDAMQRIWTGQWPTNRAPEITSLMIEGKNARQNVSIYPNSYFNAMVKATDPEGDPLTYAWSVKPESLAVEEGGDFESAIENVRGSISSPHAENVRILTPPKPGPYRAFVYVYDNQGHAAHANIPFLVLESQP